MNAANSPHRRPVNPLIGKSKYGWSRLSFSWISSLIEVGSSKVLKETDLPELLPEHTSSSSYEYFKDLWDKELEKHPDKPNLHRVLFIDFLKRYWVIQPMMFLSGFVRIIEALALGRLIQYFSDPDRSVGDGVAYALVFSVCGVVELFMHHHIFFYSWLAGCMYRMSSIAAIYHKLLRLRSNSAGGSDGGGNTGAVINLATNDVERFLLCTLFISYLFWGPLEAIVILVLGLNILGPAFAAGYVLLLFIIPLQAYLSRKFGILRHKTASITDSRMNLVSQSISGVRVMKMSGWEENFRQRISEIRHKEMNQVQKANRLKALDDAIFFTCNVVISVVIFAMHVYTGNSLDPQQVFTVMALLGLVQFQVGKHCSLGVRGTAECIVSVRRIQSFLMTPELANKRAIIGTFDGVNTDSKLLELSNATAFWSSLDTDAENLTKSESSHSTSTMEKSGGSTLALSSINISLNNGELTCIIGPVGCGKSALLLALAGELPLSNGFMKIKDGCSKSYAAQEAWIMDGTVRENITMGISYKESWYKEVLRACCLETDLECFRNGDSTLVGDRGLQLSGGQRARISLARVIYRDSDILLLDDPLSAVDSKVGRHIFHNAIIDLGIKRGKCVVLVTHQHQFIQNANCILMKRGRIEASGSYKECVEASGGSLSLAIQVKAEDGPVSEEPKEQAKQVVASIDDLEVETENQDESAFKEKNVSGDVKWSTYLGYMDALGGPFSCLFVLAILSLAQVASILTVRYIGKWSEENHQDTSRTFWVILGVCVATIIFAVVGGIAYFFFTIRASEILHNKMLERVLRSKIEFFDTNPLGRILNRFSGDVGSNDDLLPSTLFDFVICGLIVLGGTITAGVVLPFILIPLPFIIYYFFRIRKKYVQTSREVKRYEGLARSPIFAMVGEAYTGIDSIRSNNTQEYFCRNFEERHNAHSRAVMSFLFTSRWFGFRLDSMVVILCSLASIVPVVLDSVGMFSVDPATLGLALMLLVQLSGLFQWCVRQSAEVVNQLVAVERVLDFCDLPLEAPLNIPDDKQNIEWPTNGNIEFNDLSVRYRKDLPLSLKGVSVSINSGERVGVVGRTGSGKSTLIQALFRLLEAENGTIYVDGLDISKLGLHKIRQHMSVIPQTPVLFSGCTVRANLDPFEYYNDKAIYQALEAVQMKDAIDELAGGVNYLVSENGSNFSVGQRQLLCLARAILRKNKILVLDEPTANVDTKTDSLLQEAVSTSFKGSTIIAVAHRLDTIIDYDKIIVLGLGKIIEYGTPLELMSKKNGHFASMVADTGDEMAKKLFQKALKKSTSSCSQ